jgi:hypothetical protein
MSAHDSLNETVVFELFDAARGERLCERLRPSWHVGLYECDDFVLVAAELRPREDDLAILLRAVSRWAGDDAVPALRFHLDGRAYVLDAGTALSRVTAA